MFEAAAPLKRQRCCSDSPRCASSNLFHTTFVALATTCFTHQTHITFVALAATCFTQQPLMCMFVAQEAACVKQLNTACRANCKMFHTIAPANLRRASRHVLHKATCRRCNVSSDSATKETCFGADSRTGFASTKHYVLSFWAAPFARFASLNATPENDKIKPPWTFFVLSNACKSRPKGN